jgi:RimJ/RimL family protein N-acetyltransferase
MLLKPIPENPQPWTNAKSKPKMIGMVGTNRFSPQGLETGYCINIRYWGKGYATEGFRAFLSLYWNLAGTCRPKAFERKKERVRVES